LATKKFISICVLILITLNVNAQKYNTLAGVRIGDDFGISFSQRIANKNTIELIIQPGTFAGNQLTALMIKQHYPLLTKRINFFMGGGVYARQEPGALLVDTRDINSAGFGLSFGAEITFGNLSIATDYMPLITMNKTTSNQRFYTTSGISIRYVLVGRTSSTNRFFKRLFGKD